jgi:hypothetical protein
MADPILTPAPTAGWLHRGEEGEKAAQEWMDEQKKKRQPPRFFLSAKVGQNTTKLIYLDSEPVFLREHEMQDPVSKKWSVHFTCIDGVGQESCPACEKGGDRIKTSFIGVCTVIDTKEYVSPATGKKYVMDKKLLVMKNTTQEIIKKIRSVSAKGNLKFAVLDHTRTKETLEERIGETIVWGGRANKETILKRLQAHGKDKEKDFNIDEYLKPFDYLTIFAPRTAAEIERLIGMAPAAGRPSSSTSGDDLLVGGDSPAVTQPTAAESEELADLF